MTRLIYWQKGLNSFQHPLQNKHKSGNNSWVTLIRMHLMYIFRGENNEPHPYHVKSEWELPIQRSVALEVSGCDGPTEKLSSFVDKLLQPIAQQQKSYLKDTTDFVNFIENTKVPADVILVSMDVTSLYTNIPQEEGIDTVCRAYEIFY